MAYAWLDPAERPGQSPFFYWYQLAWVPISSLLTWLVWRGSKRDDAR